MRQRPLVTVLLAAVLSVIGFPWAFAQTPESDEPQVGVPVTGNDGVQETVEQLMEREAARPPRVKPRIRPELEIPNQRTLPQNPLSPNEAQWPPAPAGVSPLSRAPIPLAPQTLGTSFTGATLADSGFPPDTMGAAGPTQFIVAVNGRLRSFNRSTGTADGVLNVEMDTFFSSVITQPAFILDVAFTSDPRIRYDRLTHRWFITIIDVILDPFTGALTEPNRVLLAVSDAASNGVIAGGTVWTFFYFQGTPGDFADYDTLGIDNNALYIGANIFTLAETFLGTNGYVVRKTSVLGPGPIVVTTFANLTGNSTGPGPMTPQGVDNYDPAATEGYFIGVNNAGFGTLMLRRISTPGGTPGISGNIAITVNTTTAPIKVPHLGNTGGASGELDGIDHRLFAAHLRNGRLWTAHNIQVDGSGVASSTGGRNGSRWYELQGVVSPGTPGVRQSGTVFDGAVTTPKSYWIPSVMVSGQGHAALGFSSAGAAAHINAATLGRLAADSLDTTQGVPVLYTASSTAYNPRDPSNNPIDRWGDYSYTSLDPNDDMTMWTIQQFCDATDSYGVRVVRLIAPPPATPNCAVPAPVTTSPQNVTITGTSSSGSGFFDPGAGFPNRLQASVTGGVTVNSVTFNSPTSVTLNVTATTNGLKDVSFTNPDGQNVTGTGCISVNLGAASADLSITKTDGQATAIPGQPVTYTIVVSNPGPSAANGSTVADTVPGTITGVTWTCGGAGGGTCTAGGSGSINDTVNLPVGGSVTYILTGTISASATGSLSNTATVTAPGGVTDPNPANNSATDTDTLTPQADLSITNTDGQATEVPGTSVTYTIAASNAGPSTANGATVADTVPAAITGVSWTCAGAGGGTCAANGSGNINATVNLPVGGSVTYTLTGTIGASASGSLSNTATVAAPGGVTDPNLANNSATDTDTLTPQANLAITKTDGQASAAPGSPISYTIVASNAGPSTANGATVADTVPAAITGVSWTCAGAGGGSCGPGGPGNINDTANLPVGGTATYTLTGTINPAATGSLSNTATVTAPGGVTDPNLANNSATDTDTLTPQANLSITKTDGQASTAPGSPISYTIVASNAGPSTANGATVADTVPAAITGVTWTCAGAGGGTCGPGGPGNINDTVNLPVGGTVTYTLTGTISPSATGSLSNTATVTVPGGVTDPNPANNSATDTDTLTPQADLSIAKTDGQATASSGSPITYTIVASNAGPSTATGATVADTVPAAITGVSWTCAGAGGGTCAANGSGNINDTVNLPVGGSVTYTLTGTVSPSAIGSLSNTATVTAPGGVTDPNPANNSATDTDTVVALDYFTLTPCRVVDTRGGAPVGGPALQGQETRTLPVAGNCFIPLTAKALSVNVTVTQASAAGNVRLFPAGQALPLVSTINYVVGLTRANNAVVPLSASGAMAAYAEQPPSTTVHLIIDVNGYFE